MWFVGLGEKKANRAVATISEIGLALARGEENPVSIVSRWCPYTYTSTRILPRGGLPRVLLRGKGRGRARAIRRWMRRVMDICCGRKCGRNIL